MFDAFNSLVSWLPWIGIPAGIGVGALWWFLGGATLLKILATVFDIISPFLKAIIEGIVWTWQNIFWPGIKDILDSWVTILTVIAMGVTLYFFLDVNNDVRTNAIIQKAGKIEKSLQSCQAELQKVRRSIPKLPKDLDKKLDSMFKWPF